MVDIGGSALSNRAMMAPWPERRLSDLARGFERRGEDPVITGLSEDSRRIVPGMLFVAVRGSSLDGHEFIADAIRRGASAVAAERLDGIPEHVPALLVASGRRALGIFSERFFGEPRRELTLIGFTGTFGKTSTSDVLRRLLSAAGMPAGVIGSLGARYQDFHDPGSGLTTPAPPELHRMLRDLRSSGAETVIMEVTSHALRLERAVGLRFDGGLIAAIKSGEHTDFHGTFEEYLAAKRTFLDYLTDAALLAYDADNDASTGLAKGASTTRTVGFSIEGRQTELIFREVVLDRHGASFALAGPLAGSGGMLRSTLLGVGHLRNVALALTYALSSGVPISTASEILSTLEPLARRMERYDAAGRTVLDDTAAHPESLRATFEVAALLAGRRMDRAAVVYAVRGMRGTGINQRNADALAQLTSDYGISRLMLTAAADAAGPHDRVRGEEADAARQTLLRRGFAFAWHDALRDALEAALAATSRGDLVVLVGAQGMNAARSMLTSDVTGRASEPSPSSRS
jgi:UDP-N-acetylmuramoyl-L-alanyl-D-glutamate--2,6-diaminopimelate ligase